MKDSIEYQLLLNLALRLRRARQSLKRTKVFFEGKPQSDFSSMVLNQKEGIMNEAWNSFQAAKAIVY